MYVVFSAASLTLKNAYGNLKEPMNHHKIISTRSVRRLKQATALVLVMLLGLSSTNFDIIHARSVGDIQNEIQQKQAQKEAAASEAALLAQQATGVQGEINVLADQVASIQSQISVNTTRQAEIISKIDTAKEKLTQQKDLLSANIRSVYIEGDISPLEMIASSKNLSDFVDKQEYRDRIKTNITQTVKEIEVLKKELDQQQQEIAAILADQKTLKSSLDQKNSEAESKLNSVNQTKAGFDAQVNARQGDISSLQREVQAMQDALARVNVRNLPSSGRVSRGAVIGTVGNTGNSFGSHLHLRAQVNGRAVNPFNYLGGRWSAPLNAPITQGFGENPYRYGYGASGHDGVDYGAPSGTAIRAVEDGELYKGWSQQLVGYWHFGCMAMIRHDDGLLSIYAHMQPGNC